ncbi:TPA: hypothetical protein HA278_05950, partial [Candidatus Woesearchaeota archaeon]|nr:hypothetical protein [Candidatus Woesearchaeota archaeon]
MAKLQKLGIECTYDPARPKELHYSISINPDTLENPQQARKHFTAILNAIHDDASKKGGLQSLTVTVNDEYQEPLREVAEILRNTSRYHGKVRSFGAAPSRFPRTLIRGGAVVGGLAGLALGYDQMAEWGTNAAEYLNAVSYLWAPVAGLAQAGISVIGSVATTALGVVGGGATGLAASAPFIAAGTTLAKKVDGYTALERALTESKE